LGHHQACKFGASITDALQLYAATGYDIYVDQTNYRPVQVVAKSTSPGPDSLTLTVTYTAYNSGLHIDLPPASRVQGG
jgi:hypothetical protein